MSLWRISTQHAARIVEVINSLLHPSPMAHIQTSRIRIRRLARREMKVSATYTQAQPKSMKIKMMRLSMEPTKTIDLKSLPLFKTTTITINRMLAMAAVSSRCKKIMTIGSSCRSCRGVEVTFRARMLSMNPSRRVPSSRGLMSMAHL